MPFFRYDEPRYYFFGLKAGWNNLLRNGFALGPKRTIGKISQPINWYTRFPEYYYFDQAIGRHLRTRAPADRARILDVGSPKTFGLQLAFSSDVEVTLTDISELNVDEYRLMWDSLGRKARGKALFALEDARRLSAADGEFDVVYSMSVIEHVQGDSGDSEAIAEMIRVLRPGGLLVLSVPFGKKYMEQEILGLDGAVRPTHDQRSYFFQRVYNEEQFRRRILSRAAQLEDVNLTTVWRRHTALHRSYAALGHTARGFVGFINPVLSAICNQSSTGMKQDFAINYGVQNSLRNVYGDLILSGAKAGATQPAASR